MESQTLDVPQLPAMASANARAVSVAVSSQHTHNPAARRQQRASHSVATSSHQDDSGQHPYSDVHHHPAVEAYAAAHPRRTIPHFGPYLLLQTLGEGEFGKVKLGIHIQWGEEVAVKLIRRGNVDNAVRLSKVEREIEVLRVRPFLSSPVLRLLFASYRRSSTPTLYGSTTSLKQTNTLASSSSTPRVASSLTTSSHIVTSKNETPLNSFPSSSLASGTSIKRKLFTVISSSKISSWTATAMSSSPTLVSPTVLNTRPTISCRPAAAVPVTLHPN